MLGQALVSVLVLLWDGCVMCNAAQIAQVAAQTAQAAQTAKKVLLNAKVAQIAQEGQNARAANTALTDHNTASQVVMDVLPIAEAASPWQGFRYRK